MSKTDEFFECTPISSRDNLTFVFETAKMNGLVIGNLTLWSGQNSQL